MQSLRDVLIRKLAQILRGDDIRNDIGLTLALKGISQGSADTGYLNLIHDPWCCLLRFSSSAVRFIVVCSGDEDRAGRLVRYAFWFGNDQMTISVPTHGETCALEHDLQSITHRIFAAERHNVLTMRQA